MLVVEDWKILFFAKIFHYFFHIKSHENLSWLTLEIRPKATLKQAHHLPLVFYVGTALHKGGSCL